MVRGGDGGGRIVRWFRWRSPWRVWVWIVRVVGCGGVGVVGGMDGWGVVG